ncbi:MBL fold metallo-hydrolase [Candidatus Chloroploca sp. Khr17]|uniref:MBL fold metallo-hydrolase n=1 Tax=Candidatus Chloroploca sp. Khr17 TaxID=2496869 RepID=UPI00101DDC06|nr:MBL fold metallo-hydrolase [Candidatus Chloroploca sp. Khr17]
MRNTTYGAYLTQLTRFPRVFPVNCYLVREDDGLTLIDTGIPGSAPAILAAAERLGQPIRRIVLTHAHGDHLGSLDALHQLLPAAAVLISARDARFLAGDRHLDPDEPQTPLRGGYQTTTTRPTATLSDGDRVGSLQVIDAPGHTPGHLALLDPRDGTLIAGDAFQTRAGLAVAGTLRPLFPFPALATWHRPTALATARRLRALAPTRLAVGHGDVLEQPLAALDQAIAAAARGLGETRSYGA